MANDRIPQLHEVLAVESDLEGKAKRIIDETLGIFKSKDHLFTETRRRYTPLVEGEADIPEEISPMTTTVKARLNYTLDAIVEYWNATLQKEHTNQIAKADIIINDVVLVSDVPATALLSLEKQLKTLRGVFDMIPTLPTDNTWEPDLSADASGDTRKAKYPDIKNRLVETLTPMVLYHATDKHPAQVRELKDSRVVGQYTKDMWSSKISSADKHEFLKRIDIILRAVKEARQRANNQPLVKVNYAKKIVDYIMNI